MGVLPSWSTIWPSSWINFDQFIIDRSRPAMVLSKVCSFVLIIALWNMWKISNANVFENGDEPISLIFHCYTRRSLHAQFRFRNPLLKSVGMILHITWTIFRMGFDGREGIVIRSQDRALYCTRERTPLGSYENIHEISHFIQLLGLLWMIRSATRDSLTLIRSWLVGSMDNYSSQEEI